MNSTWRTLWFLSLAAVLLAASGTVWRFLRPESYLIDGPSMAPGITSGERVVVNRGAYGTGLGVAFDDPALASWTVPSPAYQWANPEVGDVVVLLSPADHVDIIKRVVAVAGQTIEAANGVWRIDGVEVAQEDVGPCPPSAPSRCRMIWEELGGRHLIASDSNEMFGPFLIPAHHIFIAGDNRTMSNDSRRIGPVPVTSIRGEVVLP